MALLLKIYKLVKFINILPKKNKKILNTKKVFLSSHALSLQNRTLKYAIQNDKAYRQKMLTAKFESFYSKSGIE